MSQPFPSQAAVPAVGAGATAELSLITRRVTARTGAETGRLFVLSAADRCGRVLAAWGTEPGVDELPFPIGASDGFAGRVLDSSRPAAMTIDPEEDASLGLAASGARLTYAAGAAIRPPGGPRGVLCLGFSAPPEDHTLTLWRVESYARLASLCLEERGTRDRLLANAGLDYLTGCLSYAAIRVELGREIARAERGGQPLSCCFIDLDHFKRVNDCHGHLHGNRVLAEVAATLRQTIRAGDTLGRYGGDEFLAILPSADEAAGRALSKRLRTEIRAAGPAGRDERLDISIGVAQWRPGSSADELLGAADAALLRAKERGGGTVVGGSSLAASCPAQPRSRER